MFVNAELLTEFYATEYDAFEDMCDEVSVEPHFQDLFEDEQDAFYEWVYRNWEEYVGSHGVEWLEAFWDWQDGRV